MREPLDFFKKAAIQVVFDYDHYQKVKFLSTIS